MIAEQDVLPMLAFLQEIDAAGRVFWRCDEDYPDTQRCCRPVEGAEA